MNEYIRCVQFQKNTILTLIKSMSLLQIWEKFNLLFNQKKKKKNKKSFLKFITLNKKRKVKTVI